MYNIQWKIVDKVYGNAYSLCKLCKLCLAENLWIVNHINDNNILNKLSELINKCKHLNKFLLKKKEDVKKKPWTLVLSIFVFCIFILNLTNRFFCLFLDKKDIICLMIAFAWNSELHEYLGFILWFLNIYLCFLHLASSIVTDHRCT